VDVPTTVKEGWQSSVLHPGSWVTSPVLRRPASVEDLLNLMEKPASESEPVVALNERPVQLHASERSGRLMAPGASRSETTSTSPRATMSQRTAIDLSAALAEL
jgi:hypothetical protein